MEPTTDRLDARALITLTLVIAAAGVCIPYGIASGLHDNLMDPLEWILSALSALALVGLVVDYVRRTDHGWPFAVAGFVWLTITAYVALVAQATVLWHIGNGLYAAAFAFLALTSWRLVRPGGGGGS